MSLGKKKLVSTLISDNLVTLYNAPDIVERVARADTAARVVNRVRNAAGASGSFSALKARMLSR